MGVSISRILGLGCALLEVVWNRWLFGLSCWFRILTLVMVVCEGLGPGIDSAKFGAHFACVRSCGYGW